MRNKLRRYNSCGILFLHHHPAHIVAAFYFCTIILRTL